VQVAMSDLWMPVLLGGVLTWVASGIIHMLLKYHNADYEPLKNEDEVSEAIRNGSPSKGMYTLPYCDDMAAMNTEEMQAKFTKGPVAMIAVFDNGMPNMSKNLLQQVAFFIVGACLIAYCASLSLPNGAEYMTVFRSTAAIGFLAFGWANIPFSIWYGHPWSTTARYMLDAIIYALILAGVFAWLWPAVS